MYNRILMYKNLRLPQRFREGSSVLSKFTAPQLRKRAQNSWTAVQDTFYSTKDIFERHRVVFTVATSIASVATAWAGYLLRHYHQSRIDQRLETIERAMNKNYDTEDPEFKKLVSVGKISLPACVATAGTTLIIGYGLGWRGGKWYANRKFRREQLKQLGLLKPRRWPLRLPISRLNLRWPIRLPLSRLKLRASPAKAAETPAQDATIATSSGKTIG